MKRTLPVLLTAVILATVASPFGVFAAGLPDLVISDQTHCVWQKGPGGFIFSGYALCMEVTIENVGDAASGPTHLGVFLWADLSTTPVDGYAGPFTLSYMITVPPIAPGDNAQVVQFNFPIFGPPGQPPQGEMPPHYFAFTVDAYDRVQEYDEDNNFSVVTLQITNNFCSKCKEDRCSEVGI